MESFKPNTLGYILNKFYPNKTIVLLNNYDRIIGIFLSKDYVDTKYMYATAKVCDQNKVYNYLVYIKIDTNTVPKTNERMSF